MIEDVYEPLERYDQECRDAFAQNARDEFDKLVEQSGIDVAANQTLCAEIHRLEADKARVERRQHLPRHLAAHGDDRGLDDMVRLPSRRPHPRAR